LKPRILYVSCCENGLYGLRHILELDYDIVGVVTIPPELGQKYQVSGYVDFRPLCVANGLNLISIDSYHITPLHVRDINFDLIVVNGWNRLIDNSVIQMARLGGLGVHAGHPPIGLGRSPLVWNILLGHRDIEVYVFRLTPNADDGEIMALRTVEITVHDNVRHLYEKVMFSAAALFTEAIDKISSGATGIVQELDAAIHYEKRTPDSGRIDFRQSEIEIYNFIRSQVPPYPGAYAFLAASKWTILEAQPFDSFAFRDISRRPGTVLCNLPSGLVVQTGGAPIWITSATIDGSNLDFLRSEDREAIVGQRFDII
jgi:methionyl-tRNA formyltransferase